MAQSHYKNITGRIVRSRNRILGVLMPRAAKASTEADAGFIASHQSPRRKNGAAGGAVADAASLDAQELLRALQAMRIGDFSVRLPHDWVGLPGKIADAFNDIVAANER